LPKLNVGGSFSTPREHRKIAENKLTKLNLWGEHLKVVEFSDA